ncbi:cation:dicarboxylate symporter family transporter [Streptomyces sp. NPDC029674]|uniref:cation:dicarboxylate symporter family transporter n=1 Tax=Streptomyces sp. NPDC029674 TaxID=3365297 RepID=UPI00384C265C
MTAKRPRRNRAAGGLTLWVVCGLLAGVAFGLVDPANAARMRFLSDAFISLMTLLVTPIIFVTVVSGIAAVGSSRRLGQLSFKAFVYFELATTIALGTGLLIGDVLGFLPTGTSPPIDPAELGPLKHQAESNWGNGLGLDSLVPSSLISAFARGNPLHVLLVAVLFGFALLQSGERGAPLVDLVDRLGYVLFQAVRILAAGAPLAAFGGAAYTISRFGLVPLRGLLYLVVAFYLTCAVLIFGVLGLLARLNHFSLLRLIRFLRHELLIVIGTSSSEPAFPRVLRKLELAGVPREAGAPLLASGYSLHLVGTCLYLTMSATYVAQMTGEGLAFGEQMLFLALVMIVSKTAVGVTGSGLLTLVATVSITHTPSLGGIALLVGIDRVMSEARAVTNLICNAVATLVIANWVGQLDVVRLRHALSAPRPADPDRSEDDPKVVDIRFVD